MTTIKLSKLGAYTGHHGTFTTPELQLTENVAGDIVIRPLKTGGDPAKAMISISKNDLPDLISALRKML